MRLMEVPMRAAVLLLLFTTVAVPVGAQTTTSDVTIPPPRLKTVSLSGPRFGVTALSDGVVEKLQERSIEVGSNITQFGWQFEKEFYSQGKVAWLPCTNSSSSSAASSRVWRCRA